MLTLCLFLPSSASDFCWLLYWLSSLTLNYIFPWGDSQPHFVSPVYLPPNFWLCLICLTFSLFLHLCLCVTPWCSTVVSLLTSLSIPASADALIFFPVWCLVMLTQADKGAKIGVFYLFPQQYRVVSFKEPFAVWRKRKASVDVWISSDEETNSYSTPQRRQSLYFLNIWRQALHSVWNISWTRRAISVRKGLVLQRRFQFPGSMSLIISFSSPFLAH